MAITFKNNHFILETKNTSYIFALYDGRFPVHLYYGEKTEDYGQNSEQMDIPKHYRAFSPYYQKYGMVFSPDCALSECPFFRPWRFSHGGPQAARAAGKLRDSF